jgi:hypothetical protein
MTMAPVVLQQSYPFNGRDYSNFTKLSTGFKPDIYFYTADVPNNRTSIQLAPGIEPSTTVQINIGNGYENFNTIKEIPLKKGLNDIEIKVEKAGSIDGIYKLSVYRDCDDCIKCPKCGGVCNRVRAECVCGQGPASLSYLKGFLSGRHKNPDGVNLDYNNDDRINVADLTYLKRHIVFSDRFPLKIPNADVITDRSVLSCIDCIRCAGCRLN